MVERPCVQIFGQVMGDALRARYEERTETPCCRFERGEPCFLLDRTGDSPLLSKPEALTRAV